jgi:hypothetical protein
MTASTIDTLPDDPATPPAFNAEPTAAATSLAPVDAMRQKLEQSTRPLTLPELKKGLRKPKKQTLEEFEAELKGLLDEQARAGRVFSHPSGKNAEVRFWSKNEKQALRDEALNLAAPGTLAELSKKLTDVSKANVVFIESVLRELISEDRLFEHPPKRDQGPARFGTDKYESPNSKPAVSEALLGVAAFPKPVKELVKETVSATRADKPFVVEVVNELISAGQLHEHPGQGRTRHYGVERPKRIDPLEGPKYQKALDKLAKISRKLLARSRATTDELLHRLGVLLSDNARTPESTPTQPAIEQPTHAGEPESV